MPQKNRERPDGILDIEGVVDEWDSTSSIRDRLRDGGRLVSTTDCTVKTVAEHADILLPIILRMAAGPSKVPDVNPLRLEVSQLYIKNKQDKSVEHEDVIEDSWVVRKMAGFIKMKVRRQEVSIVVWLHCQTWPFEFLSFPSRLGTKKSHETIPWFFFTQCRCWTTVPHLRLRSSRCFAQPWTRCYRTRGIWEALISFIYDSFYIWCCKTRGAYGKCCNCSEWDIAAFMFLLILLARV